MTTLSLHYRYIFQTFELSLSYVNMSLVPSPVFWFHGTQVKESRRGERKRADVVETVCVSHLVCGGEFGPGFICTAVVVVGVGTLHVLVEAQDRPGLQLCYCWPLGQLYDARGQAHRHTHTAVRQIQTKASVCIALHTAIYKHLKLELKPRHLP